MEDGVLENPTRDWYKQLRLTLSILLPVGDRLQSSSNTEGKAGSEFLAEGARRLSSFLVIVLLPYPAPRQPLCAGESFVSETNITCIDFCPSLQVIQFYQANPGFT